MQFHLVIVMLYKIIYIVHNKQIKKHTSLLLLILMIVPLFIN